MNEFPAHILIMTALAIMNMIVCHLLSNQLKKDFLTEYAKIGAFHLMLNNTPRSTVMLWSWLLRRPDRKLAKSVIFKIYIIRLIITIILVWFIYFFDIHCNILPIRQVINWFCLAFNGTAQVALPASPTITRHHPIFSSANLYHVCAISL